MEGQCGKSYGFREWKLGRSYPIFVFQVRKIRKIERKSREFMSLHVLILTLGALILILGFSNEKEFKFLAEVQRTTRDRASIAEFTREVQNGEESSSKDSSFLRIFRNPNHPCNYFDVAKRAVLKCLGLDSSSEPSRRSDQHDKQDSRNSRTETGLVEPIRIQPVTVQKSELSFRFRADPMILGVVSPKRNLYVLLNNTITKFKNIRIQLTPNYISNLCHHQNRLSTINISLLPNLKKPQTLQKLKIPIPNERSKNPKQPLITTITRRVQQRPGEAPSDREREPDHEENPPANAKISKEAKETVQECVSEFISFVTGEASDKCQREKRKTVNGDDLLWAMTTLGFDDYVVPLKDYLSTYRESDGETREKNEKNERVFRSSASASSPCEVDFDAEKIASNPSFLQGFGSGGGGVLIEFGGGELWRRVVVLSGERLTLR
ncbi:hypothetical protein SASPL_156025 [Salvia splendens]|uniref:Transcription factor CBF/NF-Y/archaeal histone domain-containing protein n=1 Tax=Salvia splendens TaxID=180675 RepID=A0A8X8YWN3_SALSN|nr:hypothetical protein SASPL_156025 [Salvia splendens]